MNPFRAVFRPFCVILFAITVELSAGANTAAAKGSGFSCEGLGVELKQLARADGDGHKPRRVVVLQAPDHGPAVGVHGGDVLVSLDGIPIWSPRQACRLARDGRPAHVLLIQRGHSRSNIPLVFEKPAVHWGKPTGSRRNPS